MSHSKAVKKSEMQQITNESKKTQKRPGIVCKVVSLGVPRSHPKAVKKSEMQQLTNESKKKINP